MHSDEMKNYPGKSIIFECIYRLYTMLLCPHPPTKLLHAPTQHQLHLRTNVEQMCPD